MGDKRRSGGLKKGLKKKGEGRGTVSKKAGKDIRKSSKGKEIMDCPRQNGRTKGLSWKGGGGVGGAAQGWRTRKQVGKFERARIGKPETNGKKNGTRGKNRYGKSGQKKSTKI